MAKNKSSEIPHYELLYIIPNVYTEDDVKGIQENVNKLIESMQGKITHTENWGKKKFCYPIKHNHHGYYQLVEFDLEAEKLDKIHTELRMNHEILRHMIVNKIILTPEQVASEKKRQDALIAERNARFPKEEPAKVAAVPVKESAKKISAKELDDKLDKILETNDLL